MRHQLPVEPPLDVQPVEHIEISNAAAKNKANFFIVRTPINGGWARFANRSRFYSFHRRFTFYLQHSTPHFTKSKQKNRNISHSFSRCRSYSVKTLFFEIWKKLLKFSIFAFCKKEFYNGKQIESPSSPLINVINQYGECALRQ